MSTSNFTFGEDEQEYLLEREAIAEFDGCLTREDAREFHTITNVKNVNRTTDFRF